MNQEAIRRSINRRALVRGAFALGVTGIAGGISACSDDISAPVDGVSSEPAAAGRSDRVLLAYFSRPGENYYYGDRIDLVSGNTQVLIEMIADRIACDVYRIEPTQPYPFDYEATVEQNRREQRDGVLPAIANPVTSIDDYDVIVLASPVWNSSAPMIMRTFVDALDFTGKTIIPVTTHAVSGLSGVPGVYQEACPGANFGEGLAVQGEEVADAAPAVEQWLARVGLA